MPPSVKAGGVTTDGSSATPRAAGAPRRGDGSIFGVGYGLVDAARSLWTRATIGARDDPDHSAVRHCSKIVPDDADQVDRYFAPPTLLEPFDFIGWLEDEFGQLERSVVWLYRQRRMAIKIGRVEGDRYPSGPGHQETYGLWAPAIADPHPGELEPGYGYGTQTAALTAYLHDLQGNASSELANLKVRDHQLTELIDAANAVEQPERVLMHGRATLHDLGAWPWVVVGDGILPQRVPWWRQEGFAAALRDWDHGRCDPGSIAPWATS